MKKSVIVDISEKNDEICFVCYANVKEHYYFLFIFYIRDENCN